MLATKTRQNNKYNLSEAENYLPHFFCIRLIGLIRLIGPIKENHRNFGRTTGGLIYDYGENQSENGATEISKIRREKKVIAK